MYSKPACCFRDQSFYSEDNPPFKGFSAFCFSSLEGSGLGFLFLFCLCFAPSNGPVNITPVCVQHNSLGAKGLQNRKKPQKKQELTRENNENVEKLLERFISVLNSLSIKKLPCKDEPDFVGNFQSEKVLEETPVNAQASKLQTGLCQPVKT